MKKYMMAMSILIMVMILSIITLIVNGMIGTSRNNNYNDNNTQKYAGVVKFGLSPTRSFAEPQAPKALNPKILQGLGLGCKDLCTGFFSNPEAPKLPPNPESPNSPNSQLRQPLENHGMGPHIRKLQDLALHL